MDHQVFAQMLGNYGEFVGAIAVVATLAYLAVQIQQNTRAIKGATLNAITEHKQAEIRWSGEIGVAYRKSIEAPQEMTKEEEWQMNDWMIAAFVARENEYFQYKHGLLMSENWEGSERAIRFILGSGWGVNWWQQVSRDTYAEEFCDYVDRLIEGGLLDYSSVLKRVSLAG